MSLNKPLPELPYEYRRITKRVQEREHIALVDAPVSHISGPVSTNRNTGSDYGINRLLRKFTTTAHGTKLDVPKDNDRRSCKWPRLRFSGWRVGVTWCAISSLLVLLINTIWTIAAVSTYGTKDGLGTMHSGSCSKTRTMSLWLHLMINVLGTILLAASNYCMQCLAAPTREEVDKAHERGKWLDIGVPSVRNLMHIAKRRRVLWWLLAVSGVPLHLLYNSAVFSTLSSRQFKIFALATKVVDRGPSTNLSEVLDDRRWIDPVDLQDLWSWGRLSNRECIQAYGQPFVSSRATVVAVTDAFNLTFLVRELGRSGSSRNSLPYGWLCRAYPDSEYTTLKGCHIDALLKIAATWKVGDEYEQFPVRYCLSKPVEEHCTVQFSVVIMCIVIAMNAIKASCMLSILWLQKEAPLVTLGDAVQSFLNRTDVSTMNICLASKSDFHGTQWDSCAKIWGKHRHRWSASASRTRWLTCNILCVLTLSVAGWLLSDGIANSTLSDNSLSYLWRMGYGKATSESMTDLFTSEGGKSKKGALFYNILIANCPQTLLSFLFLTYNSLYTCMLLSQEWFDFAHERKHLRVTDPVGSQRSTYRLQLPYKYGLPLLAMSGVLHWLVSQSLFLLRVTGYDEEGMEDDLSSMTALGYSCIAIITTIILGSFTVMSGIAMGFRRYNSMMPLAGSCSAAISAACHPPSDDVDASQSPLMWGALDQPKEMKWRSSYGYRDDRSTGHCSFTSFPVVPPSEHWLYA